MRQRAGFSLVEMMLVVLLGSVIGSVAYESIVVQERSARHQAAVINGRQNGRTAIEMISSELREISAVDGDIVAATDTSITFRALRKAGVVCAVGTTTETLDVAELGEPFVS